MSNILITGAASAIAQATAKIWAQRGDSFFLVDRDQARLDIVAADLKARGAQQVFTAVADLSQIDQHPNVEVEVNRALPQLDIVLIAHGTLGDQKASERDWRVAEQELHTNFLSVISLLTIFANEFEQQGHGTLATISSVAGDRGRQSNYVYATAKGGITIFTQGLRNRLAPKGVTVLTIKPGFVDTPMTVNFKKGLLWVKPDVIARGIVNAVDRKKDVVYLPWFWYWIMIVIRNIPERIFKKMKL